MATPLQYQIHEESDAVYLCLEGDLDEVSFLAVCQSLADRTLDRPVKADLRGVRHVDSTGLRALVLLQSQVKNTGQPFYLLEPSNTVRRIFRTTGLSQVFQIAPDSSSSPCSDGNRA
jgi:anti-anti-sigma factor